MSGRSLRRRVAVLLAVLVSPAANPAPTPSERCPPALVLLAPSYQPPSGFEYAPAEALRQGTDTGTGDHALGVIRTTVGWDVDIRVRTRCRGAECRLCVDRIEGTAGFAPALIRVAERLRGDRCRTEAVLAHEERHSQVFAESTRLGVQRLVDSLSRWAREQAALDATPESAEAAASTRYREVRALMEEGSAWIESRARARNEHIDAAGAIEAEIEDMERRCRRPAQAGGGGTARDRVGIGVRGPGTR